MASSLELEISINNQLNSRVEQQRVEIEFLRCQRSVLKNALLVKTGHIGELLAFNDEWRFRFAEEQTNYRRLFCCFWLMTLCFAAVSLALVCK